MRFASLFIPAAVATTGLMVVGTAIAQSTSQSSTSPQAQSGAQSGQTGPFSQDNVRQKLESGLRNIQVVNAAYVIRATDAMGMRVMMIINPPDMGSTTATIALFNNDQGSGGSGASGSGGANTGSQQA